MEAIGVKHRALTPDDPIGAANRAHAERLAYADRLYDEGRLTTIELNRLRAESQVELDRDIAEAKRSE